jgi:hypothetical protein
MSMHSNEERGRLDGAIDRAVRGMMQIDPRPGLRHRVEGRHAARPGGALWIGPATAAAALSAVILVSWTLLRTPDVPPAPQSRIAVSPAPAPDVRPGPPEPMTPQGQTPRPTSLHPQPPAEAVFGPRRDRVSAANVGRVAEVAPAAAPDAPYEQPSFAGAVAPIAPILIAPIEIAPITIAPLTVSAIPIGR